jgi:hypothetical protein
MAEKKMNKLIYLSMWLVLIAVTLGVFGGEALSEFVAVAIIIATVDGWLLTLGYKWGVIEWLQSHAPNDLIWQLFNCQYCLSWWSGLLLSGVAALIGGCWWWLLCAFVSTKITQKLIE